MRGLRVALLALLLGCGSRIKAPPPAPDAGPAAFLHSDGHTFRDGRGRQVLLRGINARISGLFDVTFSDGRAPLEPIPDFGPDDLRALRRLGFNVLRVPFNWSGLEPARGSFSPDYLARLDAIVSACSQTQVYCLLDLHQDAFSKEIGEDGAPLWAIEPAPTQLLGGPLKDLEARRTSSQVLDAFAHFFSSPSGMQDAQAEAWQEVASRYAGEPFVAGYELFNEPLAEDRALLAYDVNLTAAIRARDPSHLIAVEPPAYRNVVDAWPPLAHPFPAENCAYAPHIYTEVFSGQGNDFAIADAGALAPSWQSAQVEARAFGGPLLVTEWGIDPKATHALLYVRSEAQLQDAAMASAIFWLYEERSQAGWGLFDEPDGGRVERTPFIDALARTFPEAIAGTIASFSSRDDLHRIEVRFEGLPAEQENVIAAPDRHFPQGARATCDGAEVAAIADPLGGAVTVPCGGSGAHVLTIEPR
jgi:endoglycosylceramidase